MKLFYQIKILSAVNGSSYTGTEKVQQLKWSILSGNPTGLNGQPSFDIKQLLVN